MAQQQQQRPKTQGAEVGVDVQMRNRPATTAAATASPPPNRLVTRVSWRESLHSDLYPLTPVSLSTVRPNEPGRWFVAVLAAVEERFGVTRENQLYAVGAVLSMYLILGRFSQLVCNGFGFAYPAYASIRAVRTARKDDDTQWLIYWTVFALFSLLDFFADNMMNTVPLYWLVKCFFLPYLYAPQTRGAEVVYWKFVDPLFAKFAPMRHVEPAGERLHAAAAKPTTHPANAAVGGPKTPANKTAMANQKTPTTAGRPKKKRSMKSRYGPVPAA